MSLTIGSTPGAPPKGDFVANHPSVEPFHLTPPAFRARHFPLADAAGVLSPNAVDFIATGAIVFDHPIPYTGGSADDGSATASQSQGPRVLLIQRAPQDSMPLHWETPGGGCDDDDTSVLHACARELREEAGLTATAVGPLVRCSAAGVDEGGAPGSLTRTPGGPERGEVMGAHFFHTRRGKLVCKFYFVVDVPSTQLAQVTLDPAEHVKFVWASEEEVLNQRMNGADGISLMFTTTEQRSVILEAFRLWKAAAGKA